MHTHTLKHLLKNQKAVVTPFLNTKGGNSKPKSSLLGLFSFFNSILCFLITFLISLAEDITPIINSYYGFTL